LKSNDSFNEVLPIILNKLALNIIVQESRWTWIREQRERLNASTTYYQNNRPATLGEFVEGYNALIEHLTLASTYGLSPFISQAASPLEKHYVQEMADS
jgi:hypothetical protein